MRHTRNLSIVFIVVLFVAASSGAQTPVGTAFTYQGRITDAAVLANGIYDLRFLLYSAEVGGSQVGPILIKEDVSVADGYFTTSLDFGSAAFTGEARWMEIGVRPGASTGSFSTLSRRQELTPTPNAIQAPWSGVTGKPAGFSDNIDNDSGGDITGVTAGAGLTGGGATGDVTLSLDTGTTDGRYVLKTGDTMTGLLTLAPVSGAGLSTAADVNIQGRVLRGTTPFIHASTSLYNTAIGENALRSSTVGNYNTATGGGALSGSSNTGSENTATGARALEANTTGARNTATGLLALSPNTTGSDNTATGRGALWSNTSGNLNTSTGEETLASNNTGSHNTATGARALNRSTIGTYNTADGINALFYNTTGNQNTAMGGSALQANTTGSGNIAVGYNAGYNATTGNSNIYIGNTGVAAESATIRVGTGGTQSRFFAAGVSGVAVTGSQVYVASNGQLGVVTSTRAFKNDIRDMAEATEGLLRLRPVSFRYKEADPSGDHPLQYGLIAEEVAEVYPELVVYSDTGEPRSVQYHLLSSMLLNELQKQHRRLQAQDGEIQELRAQRDEIRELRALQERLLARIAQLESR